MLTQALAGTLEMSNGLGSALAASWLERGGCHVPANLPAFDLVIQPQKRLDTGDRVDLALEFQRDGGAPEVVIWIEAKLGSDLSGDDQLRKYADRLGDRGHLVFLPPAGYLLDPELRPEGLIETNWQDLAETIARWRSELAENDDPVAQWLTDQFLEHLGEESLYMTEAFGAVHLDHLLEIQSALHAWDHFTGEAWGRIDNWVEEVPIPTDPTDADYGPKRSTANPWADFWRHFGKTDIVEGGAWFEWGCWVPGGESEKHFAAGLTAARPFSEEEESALQDEGLAVFELENDWPRALRYRSVTDFIEMSAPRQVDELVAWVQDGFSAVCRALDLLTSGAQ